MYPLKLWKGNAIMPSEHAIQNAIRIWCGKHDYLAFRCNVGRVITADGKVFDTGLPNGFSDLLVLGNHGDIYFVECKSAKGKQRQDQESFEKTITARGFKYILAHSLEEFIKKIC